MLAFGAGRLALFTLVLALVCGACTTSVPSAPSGNSLEGRWTGTLNGRAPCVGNWTAFALVMQATGTGVIQTKDGREFGATAVYARGTVDRLDVELPTGTGECEPVQFVITSIDRDAAGAAKALSGVIVGRCCGTIATPFRLTKS